VTRKGRLRAWRSKLDATVHADDGAPTLSIDACWLLDDGSLCIDGWCLTTAGKGGDLRVREVRADGSAPWSTLFRKHRPDVVEHFFGVAASPPGTANLGFLGRVAMSGATDVPVHLEFRNDHETWRASVWAILAEPVPEEAFQDLAIDPGTITPSGIEPLAVVMQHSLPKPLPAATTAYEHASVMKPAQVNIVVPVYGDFTYLRNLLLALACAAPGQAEASIVCDDPRIADVLVTWTREWNDAVYAAPVRVLVHDRNGGFASACNTGWQGSHCDRQLLLNSDVIVDSLAADIAHLSDLLVDGVAAVAPVLLFPDGSLQHDGMVMEEPVHLPGFTLPGHPGKGQAPPERTRPFDVELLTGAAILTTNSVLRAVGGVPQVFGRGDFEDVLLSVAMARHGRLIVDPGVRWTHVEGVSYDRDLHGGLPVTLAKSMVIADRLAAMS